MENILVQGESISFMGVEWEVCSDFILLSRNSHVSACSKMNLFIPFDRTSYKDRFGLSRNVLDQGYFPYFASMKDLSKFVGIVENIWQGKSGWDRYLDDFERKELGIERT